MTRFGTTVTSLFAASMGREFQYVPFGKSAPLTDRPTITCDGRVSGKVTLELTHWTGNETPVHWYADTSTEIALRFAQENPEGFADALILNNHYDTDGVLSCWACLEPDLAFRYADLLREGAEAGDFGEWSSDRGIKLNCAVEALCDSRDEASSYETVFKELPIMLKDFEENDGNAYKSLWSTGFADAVSSYQELEAGRATLKRSQGRIVVLKESPTYGRYISPYALHRGLKESGLWEDTTRILRVSQQQTDSTRHNFYFEKIGHGWVQRLVDRFEVPDVDSGKLVRELNKSSSSSKGSMWKAGGVSGLVSICHCRESEAILDDVVKQLYTIDVGCQ
jgi:hypothetical protein